MDFDNFFDEFPAVSKDAWLEQVKKDLKSRALEELEWQADADLQVSPFVHADDFGQAPAPLTGVPKTWEICEEIQVAAPVSAANEQALEALQGGAEGLGFTFDELPDSKKLEKLFSGIHAEYIGLHFNGSIARQYPGVLAGLLSSAFSARAYVGEHLRGSIRFNPFHDNPRMIDWRYISEYTDYCREHLPGFRTICLEMQDGPATASLATLLVQADTCLQQMNEKGVPPVMLLPRMEIAFKAGKSYFLEIAKIRAFKILWLNLLNAKKLPLAYPVFSATLHPAAYTDDLYANMIRSTAMAMSAIIGGVDRLTVAPYDTGREAAATYPPAFGRRIARNVQHLLKMESRLDEIADAAAGSYYIESFTRQLAEKAWREFISA